MVAATDPHLQPQLGEAKEEDGEEEYEYIEGQEEEEEEEEEEVVMDEEEMLRMLDKMEPPLSVCKRLLKPTTTIEGGDEDCEADRRPWRVLSADQRASLRQRGFVVLDGLAPAALAAEAYEEATARAASGSLAPAHGGAELRENNRPREPEADDRGEGSGGLTGYVRSIRDDLTAFVSSEKEATGRGGTVAPVGSGVSVRGGDACEGEGGAGGDGGDREGGESAIARTLEVLARLGEDLGRMVRLKGRVEHQLAVYPAGMGARYERHRDAYPDDGEQSDMEEEDGDSQGTGESSGSGGAGGGSVSFRRITAICYLRGDGNPWEASDGGALRLYPPASAGDEDFDSGSGSGVATAGRVVFKFLEEEEEGGLGDGGAKAEQGVDASDDAPGVDVAPVGGRGVVFFSGAVEHEVLPVTGVLPRAALTTWFH